MPNPNENLRTSQQGAWMIKHFEGKRLQAYRCSGGRATIGWGHTKTARMGQTIDEYAAEVLFLKDLEESEAAVRELIVTPLLQHQFDALVSWTFNLGRGALQDSSLRKALNLGDFKSVPAQIMRWVHVKEDGIPKIDKGLLRRRTLEAALFRTGKVDLA